MGIIVYSPTWFTGVDIALQMVTVIVSFLLFLLAKRLYSVSSEVSFKRFAIGFFAISAAYILKIISDLYVYANLQISQQLWINLVFYHLTTLEFVNIFGNLAFRFILMLGFLILLIVYLRIKDKRVAFLLTYFIFIVSAFSVWSFLLFQTTMAVLAGTVGMHILMKYIEERKSVMLHSMIGFGLLFIAQICFMFTFLFERQMFVVGHITQAAGFLVLMITYFMVLRK